jgi:hypothetical protein
VTSLIRKKGYTKQQGKKGIIQGHGGNNERTGNRRIK